MPACAINWCRKTSKTSNLLIDGITFHLFPKNSLQRMQWTELCNRPKGWVPTYTSSICSRHFHKSQFQPTVNNRRVLIKNAIPTLFLQRQELEIDNFRQTNSQRCLIPSKYSNTDILRSYEHADGTWQNKDATASEIKSEPDDSELDKTFSSLQTHVRQLLPKITDDNAVYIIIANNDNVKENVDEEQLFAEENSPGVFPQDTKTKRENGEQKISELEQHLKRKLAKITILANERRRKIRVLMKSRRRLLKKNATLTKLIVQLKTQNIVNQLKVDRSMDLVNSAFNGKKVSVNNVL